MRSCMWFVTLVVFTSWLFCSEKKNPGNVSPVAGKNVSVEAVFVGPGEINKLELQLQKRKILIAERNYTSAWECCDSIDSVCGTIVTCGGVFSTRPGNIPQLDISDIIGFVRNANTVVRGRIRLTCGDTLAALNIFRLSGISGFDLPTRNDSLIFGLVQGQPEEIMLLRNRIVGLCEELIDGIPMKEKHRCLFRQVILSTTDSPDKTVPALSEEERTSLRTLFTGGVLGKLPRPKAEKIIRLLAEQGRQCDSNVIRGIAIECAEGLYGSDWSCVSGGFRRFVCKLYVDSFRSLV